MEAQGTCPTGIIITYEAYAIVEISRIEYERIDNTHAKCKIFSDNAPEKIGTWSEVRINGEVHKVASRQEFDDDVPSPQECTFIELSKGNTNSCLSR